MTKDENGQVATAPQPQTLMVVEQYPGQAPVATVAAGVELSPLDENMVRRAVELGIQNGRVRRLQAQATKESGQ